ncbi:hypothetical protein WCQ02_35765 [Paraburkholderia tropica]
MHSIDPVCLAEIRGRVARFLLNPDGEIDGFILVNRRARQVHVQPHLGRKLTRRVAVGDSVSVRGVKPRDVEVIDMVLITSKGGRQLVDDGPQWNSVRHQSVKRREGETSGEIALLLYGPKGELRGALLDNGVSLRMPHEVAENLGAYLEIGKWVQAWGHAVNSRFGQTLDVTEIAQLIDL